MLEVEYGDIREADLKSIIGPGAEEIISELESAEVLARDGDKVRQKYANLHIQNQSFAKIRTAIFLDAVDVRIPGNKLFYFNKGLNSEGQRKAYALLDHIEAEFAKIQSDPGLHGDIRVGSSILMTTV